MELAISSHGCAVTFNVAAYTCYLHILATLHFGEVRSRGLAGRVARAPASPFPGCSCARPTRPPSSSSEWQGPVTMACRLVEQVGGVSDPGRAEAGRKNGPVARRHDPTPSRRRPRLQPGSKPP